MLEKKIRALEGVNQRSMSYLQENDENNPRGLNRNDSSLQRVNHHKTSISVNTIKEKKSRDKSINLSRKDSFMTNVSRRYQEDSDDAEEEDSEQSDHSIIVQKSFCGSEMVNRPRRGFHKSQTLKEKSLSPANYRSRKEGPNQER